MFCRKDQLLKKTGPDGIGRCDYLRLLKKEYFETKSEDAKQQILANLANFSYDPINYEYIRSLNIIHLFLQELKLNNNTFIKLALAGLCNLSADFTNAQVIIKLNGIESLKLYLWNADEDIILDVIVTLTFLKLNVQQEDVHLFLGSNLVERIKYLQRANCSVRIRNVAKVFLEQYTSESSSYEETDNE